MGTWSTSITGNDTAQDLKLEYQCAFFANDVEVALKKIDEYIRKHGFHKDDESDWCEYYYSLADFMWSKGILTDTIRNEALRLIDSGHGLAEWEEAGEKRLVARRKVLDKFRKKLTSEQPQKKKIAVNMCTKPIFNIGDVIALQLQTKDKPYFPNSGQKFGGWRHRLSETTFRELTGKYIVIRKVDDYISFTSEIEPTVQDIYAVFELYDTVFDNVPSLEEIDGLNTIEFPDHYEDPCMHFICKGSMFYFRKRKYVVLGNSNNEFTLSDSAWPRQVDFGNPLVDLQLANVLFPLKAYEGS